MVLRDELGRSPTQSFIFSAVIPCPQRPARFSGRPTNGHSFVTRGVIFLMSAERLAIVNPFLVFAAKRSPVSS